MNSVRLITGLLMVLAITTSATGAILYGECDKGKGGLDMATVVWLKSGLINDLAATVPSKLDQLYYCNTDASGGITMYGYAQCTRKPPQSDGSPADLTYCKECLANVGNYLAGICGDHTGVGHAWESDSWCYVQVGFTIGICPVV
ncbi:hypothetical protein LINGRAHAP2_LOCUS33509 [Linum grandiflorum]